MGSASDPLIGFSWRSGIKRHTTGINFWNDAFLHTINRTGEKIAIFVMDTQGLFDNTTTPTDNSRIFALSTLISSMQVLNFKSMIHENELQYLQFATEYAKFAIDKDEQHRRPFQNLMLLIRDWGNYEDYEFGIYGGKRYFEDEVLNTRSNKVELQSVRESITTSFEKIRCCLLPNPGETVASSKSYDGHWSKMKATFKTELKNVIEKLLLPNNLILKKVNSQELTGYEIKTYIHQYFQSFQSDKIPKALSIYELTIENHMNNLIVKCIECYELSIYRNHDLLNENSIHTIHDKCEKRAIEMYNKARKMGTFEHKRKFRIELEKRIDKIYLNAKDQLKENFQNIKEKKQQLEDALNREEQQKKQAELAKKLTEEKLREIEKKNEQNEMDVKKFKEEKEILEARLKAEQEKIKQFEEKQKNDVAFRRKLIASIMVPVLVVGTAAAALACSIM